MRSSQIPHSKLTGYLTLAAFAKCSCKHGAWLIARGNKFFLCICAHRCAKRLLCHRKAQKKRSLRNAFPLLSYARSASGDAPGAAPFCILSQLHGDCPFETASLLLPTPALSVSGSWVEIRSCFLSAGAPAPLCIMNLCINNSSFGMICQIQSIYRHPR